MTNQEIISKLPVARKIHQSILKEIQKVEARYDKLTFEDVKNIADYYSVEGTATHQALIRIIECEHTITLEIK